MVNCSSESRVSDGGDRWVSKMIRVLVRDQGTGWGRVFLFFFPRHWDTHGMKHDLAEELATELKLLKLVKILNQNIFW